MSETKFRNLKERALSKGAYEMQERNYTPLEFPTQEFTREDVYEQLKKSIESIGLIEKVITIAEIGEEKIIINGRKRQQALKEIWKERQLRAEEITEEIRPKYFAFQINSKPLIQLFKFVSKKNVRGMDVYERAEILKELKENYEEKEGKNKLIEVLSDYYNITERQFYKYINLSKVSEIVRKECKVNNIVKVNWINKIVSDIDDEDEKIKMIKELSTKTEKELAAMSKLKQEGREEKHRIAVKEKCLKIEFEKMVTSFSKEEQEYLKRISKGLVWKVLNLNTEFEKDDEDYINEKADKLIKLKGYFLREDFEKDRIIDEKIFEKLGYRKIEMEFEGMKIDAWALTEKIEPMHDRKLRIYLEEFFEDKMEKIVLKPSFFLGKTILKTNMKIVNTKTHSFRFLKVLTFEGKYEKFKKEAVRPDAQLYQEYDEGMYYTFFEYEFSRKITKDFEQGILEYLEGKIKNYIVLYIYLLYKKNEEDYEQKIWNVYEQQFSVQIIYDSAKYTDSNIGALKNHCKNVIEKMKEEYEELELILKKIEFQIIRF